MPSERQPPAWSKLLDDAVATPDPSERERLFDAAVDAMRSRSVANTARRTRDHRTQAELFLRMSQSAEDPDERRRLLLVAAHFHGLASGSRPP